MKHFKLPQVRVHLFGYIFSPDWLPTIATFLLLPLLIGLGCWQLDRAHQKKIIEEAFEKHQPVLSIKDLKQPFNALLRYRPVRVIGHYDNSHVILIDNKTYKHRPGVHVIVPLILEGSSKRVLINRGFLPLKTRRYLPHIEKEIGQRAIIGLVQFPNHQFVLKKEQFAETWPLLAQTINLPELEKVLHCPVYPFVLLQQSGDQNPLIREWKTVTFPSYRHLGYAVQWFSLALTLLFIYIKLNIRCNYKEDKK